MENIVRFVSDDVQCGCSLLTHSYHLEHGLAFQFHSVVQNTRMTVEYLELFSMLGVSSAHLPGLVFESKEANVFMVRKRIGRPGRIAERISTGGD